MNRTVLSFRLVCSTFFSFLAVVLYLKTLSYNIHGQDHVSKESEKIPFKKMCHDHHLQEITLTFQGKRRVFILNRESKGMDRRNTCHLSFC